MNEKQDTRIAMKITVVEPGGKQRTGRPRRNKQIIN